ncbi:uncharacterized protein [Temnothorax longispinosus]|uniref:uncharacterized protein n=1 Tax=Temnothorax longispinosus TaxID=300112 RepID=UPI003A9A02B5
MTMIFNFLNRILGWADEGSKKRKASEDRNFEGEYITPKKFKSNCNMAHTREPRYLTVDDSDVDDITFLGEQKCSMSNCTRIDKEIVPTSNYKIDKDVMAYVPSNKIIPIEPSTSGAVRRAPASKLPIKVAATNLLRDELAAKAVIMQDFIPQVNKKDDERIKQRNREAEELKKMTCVLSKHNRYVRNAALEEQLARSMKFCMTVLEDREEPKEQ